MSKLIEEKNDARKARLSDGALLEVFMRRRKQCLANGYSLLAASNEAHEAVDEVQKRNAPPILPDPEELAKAARDAKKWESEI